MYNIPKINFNVKEKTADNKKAVFEITPLLKGFGFTIGSSIRRTLYSATKGAAITRVNIEGVSHEFTTVEGVKDDIFNLTLKLKGVRFKKEIDEPVELSIDVKGPGDVLASDIEVAAGVEVINKDYVITSLADSKSKLKAKITVESGYGYKEVDDTESAPIGTLKLDANFTPIYNVIMNVEETRLGKESNYEKLLLTVETDGTVDPEVCVRNAAKVLKEFYYKVQSGEEYNDVQDKEMVEVNAEESNNNNQLSPDEVVLEELHLPTRTINALRKAGIKTLGDLADRSEDDLLRIRNLGEKSIREIIALLEKEGLK
jgi:DNA-directed RNA polymerase subunit alpha